MRSKGWSCLMGIALLATAIPLYSRAPRAGATQSSAAKKKAAAAKSKKKAARGKPKPKGQTTPTADRIKEIQTALQHEGAYDGEPNGKWDQATVDAMKKYQDKNGLNSTGKIDALTLKKLGLGSETAGKGAPVTPVTPPAKIPNTTITQ